MTAALILSLAALAVVDSLNPFTIAAQAYLLGTARPVPRSLAFLATTFVTYLVGGLLIMAGLSLLLERVAPLVPVWAAGAGKLTLALMMAGAGWFTGQQAKAGKPFTPPADLTIGATIAFAVVSTLGDVPTAVPLFAAAAQLSAAGLAWHQIVMALSLYVLLYCAPLILLVGARIALAERRAEALFGRLRAGVDWAFTTLLPPLLWLGAVGLAVDGTIRLLKAC